MWESGQWEDACYSACCFGGARSKLQRLRHNVEEITAWPRAMCNHLHHPQEWEPWEEHGKRLCPSHEEAEYTAELCFAIAVAASSWWARVGIARLRVPRAPSPSCSGRRDHWLDIDPRALREWAMTPLAIALGLIERVPKVVQARDVAGSSCLRRSGAPQPSPPNYVLEVTVCRGCQLQFRWVDSIVLPACQMQFVGQVAYTGRSNSGLRLRLTQHVCEADLLAGLVFDSISLSYASAAGQSVPARRGANSSSAMRLVSLTTQLSPGFGLKFPFMSQEMVVLAFRRLFPEPWFSDFKFPMIEDVINQAPFDSYMRWRLEQEMSIESLAHTWRQEEYASSSELLRDSRLERVHKAALPPLLRYGLDPDEHFAAAIAIGESPLPTEMLPIVDDDLKFAASLTRFSGTRLQQMRQEAVGALRELHRRWKGVGAQLRRVQTDALQQTTQHRDLGFTALLVLLMSWPDVALPCRDFRQSALLHHMMSFHCNPLNDLALRMSWIEWLGRVTTQWSLPDSDLAPMMNSCWNRVWRIKPKVSVGRPWLGQNFRQLPEATLFGWSLDVWSHNLQASNVSSMMHSLVGNQPCQLTRTS